MNDNSMSNVCCSTKDTFRSLMSDLMDESQHLKNSINEIHNIMLGPPPPADGHPIDANEAKSLELAISIVLNTIRNCNDIANRVLNKL